MFSFPCRWRDFRTFLVRSRDFFSVFVLVRQSVTRKKGFLPCHFYILQTLLLIFSLMPYATHCFPVILYGSCYCIAHYFPNTQGMGDEMAIKKNGHKSFYFSFVNLNICLSLYSHESEQFQNQCMGVYKLSIHMSSLISYPKYYAESIVMNVSRDMKMKRTMTWEKHMRYDNWVMNSIWWLWKSILRSFFFVVFGECFPSISSNIFYTFSLLWLS